MMPGLEAKQAHTLFFFHISPYIAFLCCWSLAHLSCVSNLPSDTPRPRSGCHIYSSHLHCCRGRRYQHTDAAGFQQSNNCLSCQHTDNMLWSFTVGLYVHELMMVCLFSYFPVGLIRLSDSTHRLPSSPRTNNPASYWFCFLPLFPVSCANTWTGALCSGLRRLSEDSSLINLPCFVLRSLVPGV